MKKIILNCLIIVSLVLAFAVVANAENNITIYVNEQALQCDVEPYAENGRTLYVPNSEVKAHQNVGWYKSKTEADAAGAKSYSSSNSSQTSTSQSNYNNRSNSGGSAVYRKISL